MSNASLRMGEVLHEWEKYVQCCEYRIEKNLCSDASFLFRRPRAARKHWRLFNTCQDISMVSHHLLASEGAGRALKSASQ